MQARRVVSEGYGISMDLQLANIKYIDHAYGRMDVLVNNVGMGTYKSFMEGNYSGQYCGCKQNGKG